MREYPDRNQRIQAARRSELDGTLRTDNKGRQGVKPMRPVVELLSTATLAEVIEAHNELIRAMRGAKFMEGGR